MKDLKFKLIVHPHKIEHGERRYKAVLLCNEGISKGYPWGMEWEGILASVSGEVEAYANGKLEIQYNQK